MYCCEAISVVAHDIPYQCPALTQSLIVLAVHLAFQQLINTTNLCKLIRQFSPLFCTQLTPKSIPALFIHCETITMRAISPETRVPVKCFIIIYGCCSFLMQILSFFYFLLSHVEVSLQVQYSPGWLLLTSRRGLLSINYAPQSPN